MKRSKTLLVALLLGGIYLGYSAVYWVGVTNGAGSGAEAAGAAIARLLVMPHLIICGIGVVFNALGYALNKRAFALTAAILYSVAMVVFPTYFFFVLAQAILCYVAFALMKRPAEVAKATTPVAQTPAQGVTAPVAEQPVAPAVNPAASDERPQG